MRALITGASGFVGPYLIRELQNNGWETIGFVRARSNVAYDCPSVRGDITDFASVETVIAGIKPDAIFHLAAQSYVPASWVAPSATIEANIIGTVNILESVRRHSPHSTVMVCGSSEEYGMVYPTEIPIKESNSLRPLSPYGISKVAADMFGYQYAMSYGLSVVRMRAFNHTGVGRGEQFVTTTICRQAAEIAEGMRKVFFLGNVDAIRDFTDVRDVVRAYRMLIESRIADKIENGDVFNICSETGYKIREIIAMAANFLDVGPQIEHDPEKMRPSDVEILVGDCSKLHTAIGWHREFALTDTINDMVRWQIRKLRGGT